MYFLNQGTLMSRHDEWLNAIKKDIERKYAITNPTFVVDETMLDGKTFEEWIEILDDPDVRWIKYKKLNNNSFELKPFHPDPDDRMSMEKINTFLEIFDYTEGNTYFTVNKFFYDLEDPFAETFIWIFQNVPGETYYNLNEIKIELCSLLRRGSSKITLQKTTSLSDGKIIHHLHVDQNSLDDMMKTGYLNLEYFD